MRTRARFDRRSAVLWVVAIVAAAALAWWDLGDRGSGAGDGAAREAEPADAPRSTRQDVEIVAGGDAGGESAADPGPDGGSNGGKPPAVAADP